MPTIQLPGVPPSNVKLAQVFVLVELNGLDPIINPEPIASIAELDNVLRYISLLPISTLVLLMTVEVPLN